MNELEQVLADISARKKHLDLIKKEIDYFETKLIELTGDLPDDGSKTYKTENYKYTVKTGFNYSADIDALATFPDSPIKQKIIFDETSYKKMSNDEKRKFAKYITAKPKKVYIQIKREGEK